MKNKFSIFNFQLSRKYKKGYTLLELLVVIAIIVILISMATVAYSSGQKKSRDAARRSDMKSIQSAFEQYSADNDGAYPSSCTVSMTDYLPSGLPDDPKTGVAYPQTCAEDSYCFCADVEVNTGNSNNTNCNSLTFTAGNYFCVKNLQ